MIVPSELASLMRDLPIFPLPGLVMLPGEVLPLHVFEQRYRDLLAHCMERDGRFALATILEGQSQLMENPEVHPVVSLGRVARLQRTPDGRANLLLRFEAAVRIDTELSVDTSFRQVRADLLPPVDPGTYPDTRSLALLAYQVVNRIGGIGGREQLMELEGPGLTDALARLFLRDVEQRLAYLSAPDGAQRASLVESVLMDWLVVGPDAGEA